MNQVPAIHAMEPTETMMASLNVIVPNSDGVLPFLVESHISEAMKIWDI